jgi:hypothetical protein
MYIFNMGKMALGYILGNFPQTHLVTLPKGDPQG